MFYRNNHVPILSEMVQVVKVEESTWHKSRVDRKTSISQMVVFPQT